MEFLPSLHIRKRNRISFSPPFALWSVAEWSPIRRNYVLLFYRLRSNRCISSSDRFRPETRHPGNCVCAVWTVARFRTPNNARSRKCVRLCLSLRLCARRLRRANGRLRRVTRHPKNCACAVSTAVRSRTPNNTRSRKCVRLCP